MVDNIDPTSTVTPPEVTTPVTPEVAATAATEVVAPAAEPVKTETSAQPDTSKTEIVEPVKTEVAAEPAKEETALGGEKEIKSETDAKSETDTKDESKLSDEPAPLPTYEAFTVPEGFTLEEGALVEFNKELAEFENTAKVDHTAMQAFGQKLVERYTAQIKLIQENADKQFNTIVEGWKSEFEKDTELGGNRRETTLDTIRQAVEAHAGTPEQLAEFRTFVNTTKTGENPAFIRLVHNFDKSLKAKDAVIQAYKTKYESEAEVQPLAGTKPEPSKPLKPYEKMYGKASNNL